VPIIIALTITTVFANVHRTGHTLSLAAVIQVAAILLNNKITGPVLMIAAGLSSE
jgi:chromate transport protein ChrA